MTTFSRKYTSPLIPHFARELHRESTEAQGSVLQVEYARARGGKKRIGSRTQKARWQMMRTQRWIS